jgi:aminoglycoside phosphotransferase (APT) family kinase protein
MNHGDLMPGNVLVSDGRLAGYSTWAGLGRPTRPSTW